MTFSDFKKIFPEQIYIADERRKLFLFNAKLVDSFASSNAKPDVAQTPSRLNRWLIFFCLLVVLFVKITIYPYKHSILFVGHRLFTVQPRSDAM